MKFMLSKVLSILRLSYKTIAHSVCTDFFFFLAYIELFNIRAAFHAAFLTEKSAWYYY